MRPSMQKLLWAARVEEDRMARLGDYRNSKEALDEVRARRLLGYPALNRVRKPRG